MKFFRKDHLFIPEEDGAIKGRAMVGYSRRSFLGFLGMGAAALALPKPGPWVGMDYGKEEGKRVTLMFDDLKINLVEDPFTWTLDFKPNVFDITQYIGKSLEIHIGGIKEVFQVESCELVSPLNRDSHMKVTAVKVKEPDQIWKHVPLVKGDI